MTIAIAPDFFARADIVDRARELLADHETDAIARGLRELIERPYLVRMIMRGVTTDVLAKLTLADLATYLQRRPTRPIGVRQLEAAMRTPAFCEAFCAWREQKHADFGPEWAREDGRCS